MLSKEVLFMSKSKGSEPIDDMIEWEEKQYTPWEYAQKGKLPPHLAAPGNKRNAAILWLVQAVVCLFIALMLLLKFDANDDTVSDYISIGILAIYSTLCFVVGINYIKKWKIEKMIRAEQRANAHRKKNKRS